MTPFFSRLSFLLYGTDITDCCAKKTLWDATVLVGNIFRYLPRRNEISWLFSNRDERMDANIPFFNGERRRFHKARYEFAANYANRKTIADIACGTGYGTNLLATAGGAEHVHGVDIDSEAISYASNRYRANNVTFHCSSADSTALPDRYFDVVISFETIEHLPNDQMLLKEISRILKPEGLLISSTPNNWPLECAKYHVRTYDLEAFKKTLSEYFSVVEMFNQNSGCDHPFNHGQPFGITETDSNNQDSAECFIAVCKKIA